MGISGTLFGKTRLAILTLLFVNHNKRFYLTQIIKITGLGVGAVQRELAKLSDCGILLRVQEGKQVYFQVNKDCPVFKELRSLVIKTGGVSSVICEQFHKLNKLSKKVLLAFIYGEFIEGKDTADSAIDIMIIGDLDWVLAHSTISPAHEKLCREIKFKNLTRKKFRSKGQASLVKSILSQPRLFLIGDEDDLQEMIK